MAQLIHNQALQILKDSSHTNSILKSANDFILEKTERLRKLYLRGHAAGVKAVMRSKKLETLQSGQRNDIPKRLKIEEEKAEDQFKFRSTETDEQRAEQIIMKLIENTIKGSKTSSCSTPPESISVALLNFEVNKPAEWDKIWEPEKVAHETAEKSRHLEITALENISDREKLNPGFKLNNLKLKDPFGDHCCMDLSNTSPFKSHTDKTINNLEISETHEEILDDSKPTITLQESCSALSDIERIKIEVSKAEECAKIWEAEKVAHEAEEVSRQLEIAALEKIANRKKQEFLFKLNTLEPEDERGDDICIDLTDTLDTTEEKLDCSIIDGTTSHDLINVILKPEHTTCELPNSFDQSENILNSEIETRTAENDDKQVSRILELKCKLNEHELIIKEGLERVIGATPSFANRKNDELSAKRKKSDMQDYLESSLQLDPDRMRHNSAPFIRDHDSRNTSKKVRRNSERIVENQNNFEKVERRRFGDTSIRPTLSIRRSSDNSTQSFLSTTTPWKLVTLDNPLIALSSAVIDPVYSRQGIDWQNGFYGRTILKGHIEPRNVPLEPIFIRYPVRKCGLPQEIPKDPRL